jgi:dTDP-4-dehydrorhamnose 3,5-epimerase
MIFTETKLKGAFIVDIKKIVDERGFFARASCQNEFGLQGLDHHFVQSNVGYSKRRGTLKGMHFQKTPYQEVKYVSCTRGAVYDVMIDLRPESPTHKEWLGMELTEDNHRMLYIPEGFAHGYLTLMDDSEIYYMTTQFYMPEYATGVRFNDPAFGIQWPNSIEVISDNDASWPDFF